MSNMDPNRISLGNVVKDLASGFTGMAISRNELFNGNVQFGIQPELVAGAPSTLPDALCIDHQLLDVVYDGMANRATVPNPALFNIGDEVEDEVTGHRGIATSKTIFLNGCTYFLVVSKREKKVESQEMFLDQSRLKLVMAAKVAVGGQLGTGGPVSRALRPS